MAELDNNLSRQAVERLRERLPADWRVSLSQPRSRIYAILEVTAPDKRKVRLRVETKKRLDPRGVVQLATQLRGYASDLPVLVVSTYLSPAVRERLRDIEISYLDLTGNVQLSVRDPGLYVQTAGAMKAPDRVDRPARSLRGPKASRVVRWLIDLKRPPGVRELAVRANVDAGYVSRLLVFLDAEALVERSGRGRIDRVDWIRLLRRWAADAPLESRGAMQNYLSPRGLPSFVDGLKRNTRQYAVTGSLAAVRFAAIAPGRLATVYVAEAASVAKKLDLRLTETGANVVLIEPTDSFVYERAMTQDGISYAAVSQVAADLMTSPGRGPSEAEALVEWMGGNEEAWRG